MSRTRPELHEMHACENCDRLTSRRTAPGDYGGRFCDPLCQQEYREYQGWLAAMEKALAAGLIEEIPKPEGFGRRIGRKQKRYSGHQSTVHRGRRHADDID